MKYAKKRKKTNKFPFAILFAMLFCVCAVFIILFIQKNKTQQPNVPVVENISSQKSSVQEEKQQVIKEDTTVNFIGVGDDLIHEAIYQQANERAGENGYDFAYAYNNVADIIKNADIASINQETVMADMYKPSAYPLFNSPVELAKYLQKIGFDVFNQANNHVLDKGEKGLISTLDLWKELNAISTGAYKNQEDYEKIRTLTSNDITFSFIGMTEYTNGLSLPKDSDIVLLQLADEEKIKERILKAKEISDVVVVNAHWGQEYTNTPTELQKDMAQKMIEWGADIILGHHPHVIQPVEYIQRQDGSRGIVVYSLGNFISAQDRAPRMIGGMLKLSVTKSFKENKVEITSAKFDPVVNHYDRGFKNLRIYMLSDYTDELAKSHGVRTKNPDFSLDYINSYVKNIIDEQFLK